MTVGKDGRSSIERFIDRHQLWPFYRTRRYSEETMAEIEDTNRLIREHYDPLKDENYVRRLPREHNRSGFKYGFVEEPKYLAEKQCLTDGFDLEELEFVIDVLCHGDKLPPRYEDHRLKGEMRGHRRCCVDDDLFLTCRFDHRNVVLCSIGTDDDGNVSKG